jgi:hypothetical protein
VEVVKYYYVMCQKGSLIHRAYVQLDSASADILHDHLESKYDLCQVCPVTKADIDPDIVIAPAP